MGIRLRILIIIGVVLALSYMISMIKKEKLELKYSLSWIIAAGCIMFMALFPISIDFISNLIGIASPVNALFFIGMCFILIILFSLTIAASRSSKKLKDLIQKLALLEYELENKDKEYKND